MYKFEKLDGWNTDKKENIIFLIYKEIQRGSGPKPYMRKGFLIYEEMRKYSTIYEEAVSHIWLCSLLPIPFEFPYIWGKFLFFFSSEGWVKNIAEENFNGWAHIWHFLNFKLIEIRCRRWTVNSRLFFNPSQIFSGHQRPLHYYMKFTFTLGKILKTCIPAHFFFDICRWRPISTLTLKELPQADDLIVASCIYV